MKKILKVLLTILIILAVLAGAVVAYLAISNAGLNFESDDVGALISAKPMDLGKKLAFSAQKETMSITADKGDIYWFLQKEYGSNIFEGIEEEFEEYDAELKGYRLNFKDGEAGLNMKVECSGKDINLYIPCELKLENNQLFLNPTGLKIFGFNIDLGKISGGDGIEGLDGKITPILLESIDKAEVTADGIKLTGPMSARFMGMARNGFTPEELDGMRNDKRCSYAAEILYEYSKNPDNGKKIWMEYLEKDPALFGTIYPQLLSMIGSEHFGSYYIKDQNYGYIFRVIPDFDMQTYFDNYDVLAAEYKISGKE